MFKNAVYETWCATCEAKSSGDEAVEHGSDSHGSQREITLFKYIGETARSPYERGQENLSDVLDLSHKSHILKHFVDSHMGEDLESVKFHMKVLRFHKTSFGRQIFESVLIQENRFHNLLNSKSEYNRCAIPRLTLKMGDKEMKITSRQREEEMKKEEDLMAKIRGLRKDRNRKRGNVRGNPVRKKIRLETADEESLETQMVMVIPNCRERNEKLPEKRQK